MTFQEAEKQLLRIAAGRYCSLQFRKTIPEEGYAVTECWLYVDGGIYVMGKTWAEAFIEIEKALGIVKIEETPNVDDGEIDKADLATKVCGMEEQE